ncbi:POLD4 [Scenedesmus sp. PABB004]|nr:POLD4 [Scenedesmus sp. PABB004]
MQGKVSDHFRASKPGSSKARGKAGKAAAAELLGAHGEAATSNLDVSEEERLLRAFDLETRFGPCAGLSRLERWERAEKFGLSPPPAVKALLTGPGVPEALNRCLWDGRI